MRVGRQNLLEFNRPRNIHFNQKRAFQNRYIGQFNEGLNIGSGQGLQHGFIAADFDGRLPGGKAESLRAGRASQEGNRDAELPCLNGAEKVLRKAVFQLQVRMNREPDERGQKEGKDFEPEIV